MSAVNFMTTSVRCLAASLVFSLAATISGCGGGGGDTAKVESSQDDPAALNVKIATSNYAGLNEIPANRQEAARFLTQATFGPTPESIDRLMAVGYTQWISEQVTVNRNLSYKTYWEARDSAIKKVKPSAGATAIEINHAFWAKAMEGHDQLRQRVGLALSEIFVVSMQDGCASNSSQGAATYYDMLNERAFGTYRQLLESVALHPIMGCYLSHLRNQKEDVVTGRVPDENFAREVMQLFSIGLVKLNSNGTPVIGSNGQPVETYTAEDVAGLAKVFTGWGWACPEWPSDNCFRWGNGGTQGADPARWMTPMKPYARFHSTSEKKFLGTTIPAQTTPDPQKSLQIALDALAKHPNVAPFIGKQLIQRLVTSNPSPAYVQRVSGAFVQSGGNLKDVVIAVLLDPEARDVSAARKSPTFGKAREPILKLSALLRAYGAKSATGSYLIWSTLEPGTGLGQSAFNAPSVFNFFRPQYTPPGSNSAAAGLVAPELQIMHETSSAGYVNYLHNLLWTGFGSKGFDNTGTRFDVQLEFQRNPSSPTIALAKQPAALVEDVNQRLMYGDMPAALKAEITAAVSSIDWISKANPTAAQIAETYTARLRSAILLTMASPEFQVQK